MFVGMSERNFGDIDWQKGVITKWEEVNPTLKEVWLTRRERWMKYAAKDWKRSVRVDPRRPDANPEGAAS